MVYKKYICSLTNHHNKGRLVFKTWNSHGNTWAERRALQLLYILKYQLVGYVVTSDPIEPVTL